LPYAYNPWMENMRQGGSMIPPMTPQPMQQPGLDPRQMGLLTSQGYPSMDVQNLSPEDLRYMTEQDPKQQIWAAILGAIEQMASAGINRGRGVPNVAQEATGGGQWAKRLSERRGQLMGGAQTRTKEKAQMEAFMKQFGLEQGGRERIQTMGDVAGMEKMQLQEVLGGEQARGTAQFESTLPGKTNVEPLYEALIKIGIPPEAAQDIISRHLAQIPSEGKEANQAVTTANSLIDNAKQKASVTSTFGGTYMDPERYVAVLEPMLKGQPSEVQNVIQQDLSFYKNAAKHIGWAREAKKAGAWDDSKLQQLMEATKLREDELPEDLK